MITDKAGRFQRALSANSAAISNAAFLPTALPVPAGVAMGAFSRKSPGRSKTFLAYMGGGSGGIPEAGVQLFPWRLRYHLDDAQLQNAVLHSVLRCIEQGLRQSLPERGEGETRIGAVVFIHRFGGSLTFSAYFAPG